MSKREIKLRVYDLNKLHNRIKARWRHKTTETPLLVVGDKIFRGVLSIEELTKAVQQAQDAQKYTAIEQVQVGILSFYYKVGHKLVPRYLFYLGFFLGLFIILLMNVFLQNSITATEFLALLSILIVIAIFLYESYRIITLKPI